MQMKQISAKLDGIVEYQEYQLLRDRDRDIVSPFLIARDYILEAQESTDKQYQIEKLNKAADKLKEALTSVYTDMSTTANQLTKLTDRVFITKKNQRNTYMRYLAGDLQMATKFVGVQMHVYEFLGDKSAATLALENYQHCHGWMQLHVLLMCLENMRLLLLHLRRFRMLNLSLLQRKMK